MFKALVLNKQDDAVTAAVEEVDEARLPEGDVTVAVAHSTLNYKDGLIIRNKARRSCAPIRTCRASTSPAAVESAHPDWRPGDAVVLTGWGVGERRAATPAPGSRATGSVLPRALAQPEHAAVGTAGFTAMLAVLALEHHGLRPGDGEVLVTAPPAGSARWRSRSSPSSAIRSPHRPAGRRAMTTCARSAPPLASTGRSWPSRVRALESERFAGCIDAVGGTTLAQVLAQMKYRCSVAAVGLAGGSELRTTVIPFLLRGVNLLGIDSVYQPAAPRRAAWSASRAISISQSWKP